MHLSLVQTARRFMAGEGKPLSVQEALELAALPASDTMDLFSVAGLAAGVNVLRTRSFTCGIINAKSGRCPENCAFCAQSAHYRTGAPEYPLVNGETLLRRAEELAAAGAARFGIVTSGTALNERELDALCAAVQRITAEVDIRVCGSLGQLNAERAKRLVQAGMRRYHHNLETAASFFPKICSTHDYKEDVASLAAARAAGLEICCGGIFGLGESWAQRVEFSHTLAELDVDAIPVNFLTPIPGTPLEGAPRLRPGEALRILSILRLMHPGRDIIVCGGRAAVLGTWQPWIFAAGANAMMTGNYLTTAGNAFAADRDLLNELGLLPEQRGKDGKPERPGGDE